RNLELVSVLDLFSGTVASEVQLGSKSRATQFERQSNVVVLQCWVECRHQDVRGRFAKVDFVQRAQRGKQPVYAHGCARCGNALAKKTHDEIVVTAAAEDGSEIRSIKQHRFKHRTVVIRETSGDAQVNHYPIIVIPGNVKAMRNLFEDS